jgi:calcium-dependent protein kinase
MNPLVKTCLIESNKESADEATYESDPYFDDNLHTFSSHSSSRGNLAIPTPQLGNNIVRENKNRDPYEVYNYAKSLGNGSMGTVQMVKKRKDHVGGSARVQNLSTEKRLQMHNVHPMAIKICKIPTVGQWFESCTGLDEHTKNHPVMDLPADMDDTMRSTMSINNLSKHAMNLSMHQPNHIRISNFLAKQRSEGDYEPYYALKSIHLSRVDDASFRRELRNEINLMRNLDHAHIARLIETYDHKKNIYMVLELCSGGDLYTRDPYTEDQATRIANSITSAVAYMHDHDIIHRDLKYENIMFATNHPKSEIKIIDFGLSKKYLPNQKLKDGVGTVYTMSPQVLEGDYDHKADVWAIGVLTYMLLSSQMPFYGRTRREILEKIMKGRYDFNGRRWAQISVQGRNFVSDLLQCDPESRPSAEEAKQDIWLNKRMYSSMRTATDDDMHAVASSIERFSSHPMVKKLGLMIIAHKSSSDEIKILRKAFKRYDNDKKGRITYPHFSECMKQYGYNDDYIEYLFNSVDLDGTKEIKYTEFLAASIESTGLITEERVAEAFDRLDSDDSGYISFQNLRDILGDDVPKEYINQVIEEVDLQQDHKISYDEFLAIWDEEIRERKLELVSGISPRRTVADLAHDIVYSTTDDESGGSRD